MLKHQPPLPFKLQLPLTCEHQPPLQCELQLPLTLKSRIRPESFVFKHQPPLPFEKAARETKPWAEFHSNTNPNTNANHGRSSKVTLTLTRGFARLFIVGVPLCVSEEQARAR